MVLTTVSMLPVAYGSAATSACTRWAVSPFCLRLRRVMRIILAL